MRIIEARILKGIRKGILFQLEAEPDRLGRCLGWIPVVHLEAAAEP